MRILKIIRGVHPTFRPDVTALFGRYLPRFGIYTDLVAQAADDTVDPVGEWEGGRLLLCRRTGNRTKDQLLAFAHDVKMLWRARPAVYDAIQVRDKVFAAVIAIWVAQRRGLPVFYWMSFPMSEGYIQVAHDAGRSVGVVRWLFLMLKGFIGRTLIYRYVLPRCTHVFVQSVRMLDDVAARGVSRHRMTAVPMGVDLERPVPKRADAFRDERLHGRRVVAYLGSFERSRRLEFLLEVTQELASTVPNTVLLMIGDGNEPEDRRRLERRADALGVSNRVVWTGWLSPADAWRWLAHADVAVSIVPRGPLYDCASPTKVVEYLALGIPVVANDQPDQKKVLEESGAGICIEMDRSAFVSAIKHILLNPDIAEHMRTAGPRYVIAERGYEGIASEVAGVYRRFVPVTA